MSTADSRQELLGSLVVRRIDKDAYTVEREYRVFGELFRKSHHTITVVGVELRCTCAWSIFNNGDCSHIVAARKFINAVPRFKAGDKVTIKGDSRNPRCTIHSVDQRFKPFRYRLANSNGVIVRNEWFETQLEPYNAE